MASGDRTPSAKTLAWLARVEMALAEENAKRTSRPGDRFTYGDALYAVRQLAREEERDEERLSPSIGGMACNEIMNHREAHKKKRESFSGARTRAPR